jgi:hypothetical protein
MDKVEIAWPSGRNETLESLAADFLYTIREGAGVESKTELKPRGSR